MQKVTDEILGLATVSKQITQDKTLPGERVTHTALKSHEESSEWFPFIQSDRFMNYATAPDLLQMSKLSGTSSTFEKNKRGLWCEMVGGKRMGKCLPLLRAASIKPMGGGYSLLVNQSRDELLSSVIQVFRYRKVDISVKLVQIRYL